jgi:hypothetical protein
MSSFTRSGGMRGKRQVWNKYFRLVSIFGEKEVLGFGYFFFYLDWVGRRWVCFAWAPGTATWWWGRRQLANGGARARPRCWTGSRASRTTVGKERPLMVKRGHVGTWFIFSRHPVLVKDRFRLFQKIEWTLVSEKKIKVIGMFNILYLGKQRLVLNMISWGKSDKGL